MTECGKVLVRHPDEQCARKPGHQGTCRTRTQMDQENTRRANRYEPSTKGRVLEECGVWMPRVKSSCARNQGHQGDHKDAARLARARVSTARRQGYGATLDYDPEDYAEEIRDATDRCWESRWVVQHSDPPVNWFVRRVVPILDRAFCWKCRKVFNPSVTLTIIECGC